MKDHLTRWFLMSCGVILAVTALAKFIAVTSDIKILARPDPLFSVFTNRQLLLVAALMETAVATCVFNVRKTPWTKLVTVAWIGMLLVCGGLHAVSERVWRLNLQAVHQYRAWEEKPASLSDREYEVVRLLRERCSNKAIAEIRPQFPARSDGNKRDRK